MTAENLNSLILTITLRVNKLPEVVVPQGRCELLELD